MEHTPEGGLLTNIILDTFKLNGLLILEGDQLIKDLGLTSARWKVLGALSASDSPITVSNIARNMGQSRQSVQRLTNEMLEEGLLISHDNPDHKRAKLFSLTDEGCRIYEQAMQKQAPWANNLVDGMSETDLKAALSVLQELIRRFE